MFKSIWDFVFCWHSWEDEQNGPLTDEGRLVGNWYQQRCIKCGTRRFQKVRS